jgi:hypothetical protein
MDCGSQLTEWVKTQHQGQLVRKTYIPYFEHLLFVAQTAEPYATLGYEIGLCHDLFEKTEITDRILLKALIAFGYSPNEAENIKNSVTELTNHFNKIAYPDLKKKERKELEDERLQQISSQAQTVKYADLWYNAGWMMQHDRAHAKKYLERKIQLLENMKDGNQELQEKVLLQFKKLLNALP